MSEKIVKKNRISSSDEILFTNHMADVLEKGFLGTDEIIVLGGEPSRRFFSGVLFPSDQFTQEAKAVDDETKDEDPNIQYRSLTKNFSMGLEFLAIPEGTKIKGEISGSFNLYSRIFPTYGEQTDSLKYLMDKNSKKFHKPNNGDKSNTTKEQKGITLLEKYRQLPISFKNIPFEIDSDNFQQTEISLKSQIDSAVESIINDDEFFNVSSNFIHKTGFVEFGKNFPNNSNEYNDFLNSLKSKDEVRIPDWNAKLVIDPIIYKDKNGKESIKIIVTLINNTPINFDEKTGHPIQLFDSKFSISIEQGIHLPFVFDGATGDYKYDKTFNVRGINCVGEYKNTDFIHLSTRVIPRYFQQHYRTREDFSVSFNDLLEPSSVTTTLNNVLLKMQGYLNEWKEFLENYGDEEQPLSNEEEVKSCLKDMLEFEEEIASFELGIYVLRNNSDLMRAFNLMNKVFKESGKGKYNSWRLFQIIFIIRILPSLYNREIKEFDPRKEEINEASSIADVLWFPTGGGKTEAYLGLIISGLFFDRFRGKKIGCSSWIRFPLRMLSKNQLDRLARVMIYAEEIRQSSNDLPDKGKPFSIGFFAGGRNTDNFATEKVVNNAMQNSKTKKNKMLIHKCPRCSHSLEFSFDKNRWRYLHICNNSECFVNKSSVLKGIIPIYITDSEVYRFLPSVICGTVDKLAILGRYREFSHIFGQIGGRCDTHGYFSDRCIVGAYDNYESCNERAKNNAEYKKKVNKIKMDIHDPIPLLLIQDELHLLKEELGALDGHYEGILFEYTESFGREKNHLPKVIAATATIESYEGHIKHLYMRKPRKYPSMGYKKGESFYATSKPNLDKRLYIGVLPHTKSQEEVMSRAIDLYQGEINRLYTNSEKALNELNFESITNIEEFKQLLAYYDLSTIYVNTKNTGFDVKRRLEELSLNGWKLNQEILTGENDMDKIIEVIDRIETESVSMPYEEKLHTLIATSLISHGVDLDRINNFFMAGMPSKQAEYIQASSRSARSHTGLVFVSFRSSDLRERSQYQFFIQNHIFMDFLIDPVPINRFALKAIERTLPGLLSGLLLGIHSQYNNNSTIYNCGIFKEYKANNMAKGKNISAMILEQLFRIYGVYNDEFPINSREKVKKYIRQLYSEKEYMLDTSSNTLKLKAEEALNPITSFRDIEEGLTIQASIDTSFILNLSRRSRELSGGGRQK